MRLKQINIINFGRLSHLTFKLPETGLTVFYGKNEAGKSTTVAFIKQILFGFYLRSNASPFFEDYRPLAPVSPMGGSLIFTDGEDEYELQRLWAKGENSKKGELTVKKNQKVIDASLFFSKIHQIDGSFYTDSFIYNQEMLEQVGSLSQKDLLERIYYLGAKNSSELLQLRNDFDKAANSLFKKTGKKPEVNRLLQVLEDKTQALASTESEFQDYQVLSEKMTALKQVLKVQEQGLDQLNEELQGQEKLTANLANYQKLKTLKSQVTDLAFDSENYQQAQNVSAQIKNLTEQTVRLKQEQPASGDETFISEAKVLLQKRSEVLQWQAQLKSNQAKQGQLSLSQKQLLALNPTLKAISSLSDSEVVQMKEAASALKENTNNSKSDHKFEMISVGIGVVGLIGFFLNPIIGIGLIILGLSSYFYSQTKDKELKRKVQENLQKQRAFTEKYGFKAEEVDLASLVANLTQYRLIQSELETSQVQGAKLLQKLTSFATKLGKLLKLQVEIDPLDFTSEFNQLEQKLRQNNELRQAQKHLAASLKFNQEELKQMSLKLQQLLVKAQVKDMASYEARYRAYLTQNKLKTQIEVLTDSLKDQLAKLNTVEPATLKTNIATLTSKVQQQKAKITATQKELAVYQVKMTNLADSNAVFTAKQDLANTESEFLKTSQEYLANLFAGQWINRALDLASNERFPKMLVSAKEYFKLLTGNRYQDIVLDKKLQVVNQADKKVDVKYLSRATAEQLYFALKLAFAKQIADQIELPILIDDSFVNFDDDRIGFIKLLLTKISQKQQVLIFTAQHKLVTELDNKPLTFEGN